MKLSRSERNDKARAYVDTLSEVVNSGKHGAGIDRYTSDIRQVVAETIERASAETLTDLLFCLIDKNHFYTNEELQQIDWAADNIRGDL